MDSSVSDAKMQKFELAPIQYENNTFAKELKIKK